jgi:hypothetical protein
LAAPGNPSSLPFPGAAHSSSRPNAPGRIYRTGRASGRSFSVVSEARQSPAGGVIPDWHSAGEFDLQMDIIGFIPIFLSWAVCIYLASDGFILAARNLQIFSEAYLKELTSAASKFRVYFVVLSTGSLVVGRFSRFGESGIFDTFITVGTISPIISPVCWIIYIHLKSKRNGL